MKRSSETRPEINDKMLMLNHYLLLPYLPQKNKESKNSVKKGETLKNESKVRK